MEKYVSKQVKINKPASLVYTLMSDFNNFTPMVQDKVEDWHVEGDTCSFKVKGFTACLRMLDKTPYECIKITGDEGSPFEFFFWIQLKQIADNDTRMRLTIHIKLNMMMKMMVGKKLEKGIDDMAEKIAEAFNNIPG
ncbi:MAG: polyketide cyclase [Rikenellaceae bacterium]|nr:polyketide cyclase [Rikenellaceae bacterium]